MFCAACGKNIPGDSLFCEFCGARRASAEAVPPGAVGYTANAAAPAPASVTAPPQPSREQPGPHSREQLGELAQVSGKLIKSMTLGEKFTALGALGGILGFFLPWGTIPNLGDLQGLLSGMVTPTGFGRGTPSIGTTSVSGFDMASTWGGVYFVLLGAIAAGILFFVAGKAPLRRKLTISSFQVLIGSLVGPQVLFGILFTPMAQKVAGAGLWITCLGYCAIAAGGIISVVELGKRLP